MKYSFLFAAASADVTKLASFDGTKGQDFKWLDTNDPVMGGRSTSTFKIEKNIAIFNGTCAIVPSLKAPGFAKVTTERAEAHAFRDVSKFIEGGMQLRVRSNTPDFAGFRLGFAAKGIPRTSIFGGGSFKSGFNITNTNGDFEVVSIPFTSFSYDWSGFTGTCGGKDPNGQQHHCCSKTTTPTSAPKYCPTTHFLQEISDLEVWAEGAVGDFHLEIDWIGAGDSAGPAPGPAPSGSSIVDLAVATPDLSTLVTALKAGKLVETLSGAGPFTVFAPTNEAFAKLPSATLKHLLEPQNIKELDDVLTYHVASGSVHAKDLKDHEQIKTVEGKDVEARIIAAHVFINDAEVTKADIDASNGVIHIIDSVLIPKA